MSAELPHKTQFGPGGLVLDPRTRQAFVGERELNLTRQGFDLLAYLLQEQGRVVPTSELVSVVWGHSVVVGTHFVQTAIYRLREALRSEGIEVTIEAVRGVGYRIGPEEVAGEVLPVLRGSPALEAALRVLKASPLPSLVINAEQRVLFANDAMARLSGYTIEELEALPSSEELSPPAVRERRKADLATLMTGSPDGGWAEPILRRDGTIVHLEMFAHPIEVDGTVIAVLVQFWLKRGEMAEIEPLWRPQLREIVPQPADPPMPDEPDV